MAGVFMTFACPQTKDGTGDQNCHQDGGAADSMSGMFYINDGEFEGNGVHMRIPANGAVMFTHAYPHAGCTTPRYRPRGPHAGYL